MEKAKTQFDILEMSKIYSERDNYKILNLDTDSSICIIYFSGNALYFPNDDRTFHEVITKGDRYEWKKNILTSARKVIFVRDVKKQWYLEGINQRIDSIDKLSEFLSYETKGLDVICVGNSAGGYIATLMGCLLRASHVFCFSGQFSLYSITNDESKKPENPILFKYEKIESYQKYYSLINIIQQSQVPIFYFYPAKCSSDIVEFNLIRNLPNVYAFAFKKDTHGQTCYAINYIPLFSLDLDSLLKLHTGVAGLEMEPYFFSQKVSGYYKTFWFSVWLEIKKMRRELKDRRHYPNSEGTR